MDCRIKKLSVCVILLHSVPFPRTFEVEEPDEFRAHFPGSFIQDIININLGSIDIKTSGRLFSPVTQCVKILLGRILAGQIIGTLRRNQVLLAQAEDIDIRSMAILFRSCPCAVKILLDRIAGPSGICIPIPDRITVVRYGIDHIQAVAIDATRLIGLRLRIGDIPQGTVDNRIRRLTIHERSTHVTVCTRLIRPKSLVGSLKRTFRPLVARFKQ